MQLRAMRRGAREARPLLRFHSHESLEQLGRCVRRDLRNAVAEVSGDLLIPRLLEGEHGDRARAVVGRATAAAAVVGRALAGGDAAVAVIGEVAGALIARLAACLGVRAERPGQTLL